MATIRQQIIEALEEGEKDAKQLSRYAGVSEKEVCDHLGHIAKSLSKQGRKLKTVPAVCIACGFEFSSRQRFTKPGRCPACKSERIDSPRFAVR